MGKKGFTLIELLIVISIITILAVIATAVLNPLKRFQDSRNSVRWQQVSELLNAIKLDQVDHNGAYLPTITALGTNTAVYMIGTDTTGCDSYNTNCVTAVGGASFCVDLSDLATRGYLSAPISPKGSGNWTRGHTGYTLQVDGNNALFVRACENEGGPEIVLSR